MSKSDDTPFLVELGANTREPASKVNMDVSGTLGPDYMGQETVDVDGHPNDRPGVRYRAPENHTPHVDPETGTEHVHPEIARMDTGEELPVLLTSSMSTDPIEGTHGSYTQIVEGECARCGYDRIKVTVATLAGEHQEVCNACDARLGSRYENGYRMPDLPEDRADRARESGEVLASHGRDLVRRNDRAVELVGSRSVAYIPMDDLEAYFWALVDNDDIDLVESLEDNTDSIDRIDTIFEWLPDHLVIVPESILEDD